MDGKELVEELAEKYARNFKFDCAPFYGIKEAYIHGYKDAGKIN